MGRRLANGVGTILGPTEGELVKQIQKRLTYANVMSSIAVFMVLGGAAVAATQLPKNSVGKKQLKANAVTQAKIKRNAVTAPKIKNGSITAEKVKAGSLVGSNINLSTLGTVPSATTATTATTADKLTGQTPFFVRLPFGGSQTLATNGSVSLVAQCLQEGGKDVARILEQTSQNGAVADGEVDFNGSEAAKLLNVDTPAEKRVLVSNSDTSGTTNVQGIIDQGYVLGPDGKMLSINSEGIALGLNYGQPGCLFAGLVNAVG
jgi:hypothetical protein